MESACSNISIFQQKFLQINWFFRHVVSTKSYSPQFVSIFIHADEVRAGYFSRPFPRHTTRRIRHLGLRRFVWSGRRLHDSAKKFGRKCRKICQTFFQFRRRQSFPDRAKRRWRKVREESLFVSHYFALGKCLSSLVLKLRELLHDTIRARLVRLSIQ